MDLEDKSLGPFYNRVVSEIGEGWRSRDQVVDNCLENDLTWIGIVKALNRLEDEDVVERFTEYDGVIDYYRVNEIYSA